MTITELSTESRVFLDLLKRQHEADAARMPGLHLSRIVQDIQQTLYPNEYKRDFDDEVKRTYFELGNAVEDVIATALSARMATWEKPDPILYRGVWCSADGRSQKTLTIDEVKACWKSSRDFVRSAKFDGYKRQGLGYLKAYGCVRLRITVFFVNGDWRPPVPHPPRTFIVRPTQREIDENWMVLERHAKDRGWL